MRLTRLDPRTWSLGTKIGATLVVATLAPLAVVSFAATRAGQNAVERAEFALARAGAVVGAAAVDEYLTGVSQRAEQFGTADRSVAFIESGGTTAAPSFDAVTESPDVRSVAIIDAVGRVIGASPASLVGTSVARQPWFGVAEGGKSISGVLQPDAESGRFLVTSASPARRPGDPVRGVVTVTVSSENLLAAINRTPTSAGGQVLLVRDDRIIAARDQRLQGRTLDEVGLGPVGRAASAEPQGTLSSVDLPGRGTQVVAWDTTTTGDQVVVLEPRAVLLAPITRLADRIRVALLVVGLIAVALALLVSRRTTRPVRALTRAAESIEADQDFATDDLVALGRARDDLGRLARVFARMAEQVFTRERQLRAQVQALKVEIDQERRKKDVSDVVDSDFFKDLQGKAADMRRRVKGTE